MGRGWLSNYEMSIGFCPVANAASWCEGGWWCGWYSNIQALTNLILGGPPGRVFGFGESLWNLKLEAADDRTKFIPLTGCHNIHRQNLSLMVTQWITEKLLPPNFFYGQQPIMRLASCLSLFVWLLRSFFTYCASGTSLARMTSRRTTGRVFPRSMRNPSQRIQQRLWPIRQCIIPSRNSSLPMGERA